MKVRASKGLGGSGYQSSGVGAPLANSVSVKRSELTTAARVSAEARDSRAWLGLGLGLGSGLGLG